MIGIEYLRTVLRYNKRTGKWRWRKRSGVSKSTNTQRAGKEAGRINETHGYRLVWIDGRGYCSHILAWAYVTGAWPDHQVDHRNLIRSDDRWRNLRAATRSQNNANCRARSHSKSQIKGVRQTSNGRWVAAIRATGKMIYLGTFDTSDAASAAFQEAAQQHHGSFARF